MEEWLSGLKQQSTKLSWVLLTVGSNPTSSANNAYGRMTEWLGNGLQNHKQGFDSLSYLQIMEL